MQKLVFPLKRIISIAMDAQMSFGLATTGYV